jgi:hypothetical protein
MKTTLKLFLIFVFFVSITGNVSCKKTDEFKETLPADISTIEDHFFNSHRTTNSQERILISFLQRRNSMDSFVVPTVALIGYPRWDKMITKAKAKNIRGNFPDQSAQTFFIPFVRESENFVNSAMVIRVDNSDTSFFYKSDWQYKDFQNDANNISDSAEAFAAFFMTLDNAVFGHKDFKIIDSNLFRNSNGPAEKVRFDTTMLVQSDNLLVAVEYCSPVTISWNQCPDPGNCRGAGGACDHCLAFCTKFLTAEYCWSGMVETGGTGGSGGGGTGGGDGGGTPTPPPCGGPTGRGNTPCHGGGGGGWTPVPIEDEDPPYVAPASLISVDQSEITDPCLAAILSMIGAEGAKTLILSTYVNNHLNVGGTTQVFSVKYHTNSFLTANSGEPIPGRTEVVVLPDGTNEVNITLNPSVFAGKTQEWVASVILHEMLHGILWAAKPDEIVAGDPDQTQINYHKYMFQSGVNAIHKSLRELFPTLDEHDAYALGMGGLADAYYIPGATTVIGTQNDFAINTYGLTINGAIIIEMNYRNALTGTPYC